MIRQPRVTRAQRHALELRLYHAAQIATVSVPATDYLPPPLQALVEEIGWPFVSRCIERGIKSAGAIKLLAQRAASAPPPGIYRRTRPAGARRRARPVLGVP